jgi:hypothetical protein
MPTITAQVPVKFIPVGMQDFEIAYPTLEIEYAYTPGRPAYTPRGEYAPIDPPDPAEVDYRSAKLIDGDGLNPYDHATVEGWAQDYLDSDEGFYAACREAEENSGPDPDEWLDRKRDDAGRW